MTTGRSRSCDMPQMAVEVIPLQLDRGVVPVAVQSGFAQGDHAGMIQQADDRVPVAGARFRAGIRVNADRREDVRVGFRQADGGPAGCGRGAQGDHALHARARPRGRRPPRDRPRIARRQDGNGCRSWAVPICRKGTDVAGFARTAEALRTRYTLVRFRQKGKRQSDLLTRHRSLAGSRTLVPFGKMDLQFRRHASPAARCVRERLP